MNAKVSLATSADPALLQMLATHPRVSSVEPGSSMGVTFFVDDWRREVVVGDPTLELYGLTEVADNNPLVCADQISVPSASATLALIALAPLAQAGLIDDAPAFIINIKPESSEIESALARVGWTGGVALHYEEMDLDGVVAATAMVAIRTPYDASDIDGLYSETFDRSFYLLRDETSVWDPSLVKGKPYGIYRISLSRDEPTSLLTIRLLGDPDGKCGAAQVLHAMNVMCGFEESFGID